MPALRKTHSTPPLPPAGLAAAFPGSGIRDTEVRAAMLDALAAGVALVDGRSDLVAVNAAWRRAAASAGSGAVGGIGDNYLKRCDEVQGDTAAKAARALATGLRRVLAGELAEFSHDYAAEGGPADGHRMVITPLARGGGTGAVLMHLALPERKDEYLREQAALLDQARDAIIVHDLDDNIIFWSKGAERMFGWKASEALGCKAQALLYRDPERHLATRKTVLEQGSWIGELHKRTQEGAELTVENRSTLVRDDKGAPRSVLSIDTDITERKKIEAQFLRVQRLESIGTLASGIAHDLNNVLAPILMSIDLLADGKLSPTQRVSILDNLRRSTQRGASMVRQVLTFARGMEGERVAVRPSHLLDELAAIVQETFPRHIRLTVRHDEAPWSVSGDPTQLHQALLNLCVNARDAMPRGGSLLLAIENRVFDESYAGMNAEARPGPYVVIKVQDTGTGIPPEIRDRVFDPFFTTKDVGKGTGLGLSTVLAIVKAHQGFIHLSSEVGKGSTFELCLPAEDVGPEEINRVQDDAAPFGNDELILVVDDEEVILDISRRTLERCGYRVLTAQEGATAVAIYAQHRQEIAVVLTDMMMPVMDGMSTLYALRRINPAVKVIAASGLGSNVNPAKMSDAGVKHFLRKPYRAETLLRTLREVLDTPAR